MIDPDMNVPPCPFYSDALVFDELTEFIGNAQFSYTILFVAAGLQPLIRVRNCQFSISQKSNYFF